MITNFTVLCGETVPVNYSWDIGNPLETIATTTSAHSSTTFISGYSPGLRVIFLNNSTPETGYNLTNYIWNFDDYYNDTYNIVSLSCVSVIDHTYIMPGTYNVSLRQVQTRQKTELDPDANVNLCRGRYNYRWFWNDLTKDVANATTWDQTVCLTTPTSAVDPDSKLPKWWSNETGCLQKYCLNWSWYDLQRDVNSIQWQQTRTNNEYEKKWAFETNDTVCSVQNASFLNTLETIEQSITNVVQIVVKELPPVAGLTCITQPVTGISPYTVQLSPTGCRTGSFPIDRIDWDFGDGSPIQTVTRYATPSDKNIVNNNTFITDPDDVRNFDVIHTYTRNKNQYPVFYPSLTCYSANTNTSDSCSISIGPIALTNTKKEIHLLKTRNTLKGTIYTFDIDNNITHSTTTLTPFVTASVSIQIPASPIKNTKGQIPLSYGNLGDNYPPAYRYVCGASTASFQPAETTIVTETSDSPPLTSVQTEAEVVFYP